LIMSRHAFSFLRSAVIAIVIVAAVAVTGVLIFHPSSVEASATFVQSASKNADSGAALIAVSFPRATTAGNTIVAAISWGDVQNLAVTLTDSQNNSYHRAGTGAWDSSNRQGLAIYYATNIKGGANTITARFGTSICCRYLAIHEYAGAGVLDGASYHVDPLGTTQANGITSGQITTTAAGDFIFGAMVDDSPWHSSVSLAPGTNFAKRELIAGFMSEDGLQLAAGGVSATFTSNSADSYLAGVVAFKTTASASLGSSDTMPPSVPTNLSASAASSSQNNLSWNVSTDNVGVSGYEVFRNGSQIAATTSTSYADLGLSPSTTYSYTVAAYDAAGNVSGQSNVASATTTSTPPPSVPTNLSASAVSSSEIKLTWNASIDNVGVAGYEIFRNGSPIATSSATSYADLGLSPSTTYSYTVAAYDAAGNVSGQSNATSATTAGAQSSSPISCTVQGNHAYDSGSPITLDAPTVGNLIILGMNNNSGDTVKSVSDNKGNAYRWVSIRGSDPASVEEIWYAANAAPGVTTVTINLTQSSYDDVNFYDCSGAAAEPFDSAAAVNGQSNFSTNDAFSGPSVSASTGGVIIALIAVELGNVSGVGSPFTFDPQLQNNGWAHFLNVSPGTYTPTWGPITQDTYPGSYSGLTAAFKGAQGSTTAVATPRSAILYVPASATTLSTVIRVDRPQWPPASSARGSFLTGQAPARGIPPLGFLSRGIADPFRTVPVR